MVVRTDSVDRQHCSFRVRVRGKSDRVPSAINACARRQCKLERCTCVIDSSAELLGKRLRHQPSEGRSRGNATDATILLPECCHRCQHERLGGWRRLGCGNTFRCRNQQRESFHVVQTDSQHFIKSKHLRHSLARLGPGGLLYFLIQKCRKRTSLLVGNVDRQRFARNCSPVCWDRRGVVVSHIKDVIHQFLQSRSECGSSRGHSLAFVMALTMKRQF